MISLALTLMALLSVFIGCTPLLAFAVSGLLLKSYPFFALMVFVLIAIWALKNYWR